MLSVLERVITGRKKRQAERAADYAALVRQIGDGQEPTAEDVDSMLEATSKTPEDLASDVAHYQTRVELRKLLDEIPGMEKRQKEISKIVDTENAKWGKACEAHDAVINPLINEALNLKQKLLTANTSKEKLYRGCRDKSILAERASIEAQRAEKNREIFTANEFIETQRGTLKLMVGKGRDGYVDYDGDVAKLQKAITDKRAEIEGIQAEIIPLDKRYAELEAAMLNP